MSGEEHQMYFAIEVILALLVVGIMISTSLNSDSVSNINKLYAQSDLELLSETIFAAPGDINYEYQISSDYEVNVKDKVQVARGTNLIDSSFKYYNITFLKEENSQNLGVNPHE